MLNVHNILINELKNIPENDVAVFLSAGIDSRSVLFALLELGKKPHVYSFTLNDRQSNDFLVAKAIAKTYGLEFTPIYIPTDVETLKKSVITLAKKYGCVKKTDFVCAYPFMFAYPKVKENYIADGMCADGHFCLSKKGMIHYKDKIDTFRKMYWSNPNRGQAKQHKLLCSEYGKTLVSPYNTRAMIDYFWGTSWNDVNKPKQKQPILNAFPTEFSKHKVEKHTNLQLGDSGISTLFDKLLKTDMNTNGYKSVVGIFNQIAKGSIK